MKSFSQIVILITYFFAVVYLSTVFNHAILSTTVLSCLFVFSFCGFAGGSVRSSLVSVVVVTIVFPLAMLVAIGLPAYHTIFRSIFAVFSNIDYLKMLPLLLPFVMAYASTLLLKHFSPNPSFKRDS